MKNSLNFVNTCLKVVDTRRLSHTHRKEYCRWITEAKKEETRLKRLGKAIEMLKKGVRTPG